MNAPVPGPVRTSRWDDLDARTLHDLVKLRIDVFVVEQACPYPELDGRDIELGTEHWWLADAAGPSVCCRVLTEADGVHRVGRVATRKDARGQGLAGRLLQAVIDRHAGADLVLDSQSYVQSYYAARGFTVDGDEFVEDGIPHVPMRRRAIRVAGPPGPPG